MATTLTATAVVLSNGLYPPFYPGPTAYPGKGTNLPVAAASTQTLTATGA